jgi:hypothetical protein
LLVAADLLSRRWEASMTDRLTTLWGRVLRPAPSFWAAVAVTSMLVAGGCAADPAPTAVSSEELSSIERGENIWFESTYGGERFFAFLQAHPDPSRRIDVGFRRVVETPRDRRFQVWGTINSPDCRANPAGGMDICDDPNDSGVIGIRRFDLADGSTRFGVACASCHAGFDPENPPLDANEPTWANIHPTIGNQDLDTGAIFAANLAPTDPRRIMFAAWPRGTVDTTLIFPDNIMNPGTITAFWNHRFRPTFENGTPDGADMRNGQGGEDDVGGDLAALRVYTNIGVCFAECVAPAMGANRPISIDECRERCPDFPPMEDMEDMTFFLRTVSAPRYRGAVDGALYAEGARVFDAECASCHSREGSDARVLSDDEVNPLSADPANATNACRALSTNWEEGRIWAEFSSPLYKERTAAGGRGYRTMPLAGIWSTAPFMHNQSIGGRAAPTATPDERVAVFEESMRQLLAPARTPLVNRLPVALGPFPAGTPLAFVFNRDPATGAVLCGDVIENRGHHYGSGLSDAEKEALITWLTFQ